MSYQPQPAVGDVANGAVPPTLCLNCRATMPGQMRFCRLCGYRLGEGVAEYAETVRFAETPPSAYRAAQAERTGFAASSSFPFATTGAAPLAESRMGPNGMGARRCSGRKWSHWVIWLSIALALSVVGEVDQRVHRQPKKTPAAPAAKKATDIPPVPAIPALAGIEDESFIGTDDFKDAGGGATFELVIPGSAADRAGLVGGDIITSFDGHPVRNADELEELLRETPASKTVVVTFTRNGQPRETSLRRQK